LNKIVYNIAPGVPVCGGVAAPRLFLIFIYLFSC